MMKKLLLFILLSIINANISFSQSYIFPNKKLVVELGFGNSSYDNVKSQQIILFFDTPILKKNLSGFEISGKINLESINENKHSTFLIGFVPFIRHNFELYNLSFFLQGGIGFNYINSHRISSREIGGHFIFSDMIGVGANLLNYNYFSLAISYLFRHISNAGLYRDNEGYNSQYLLFTITI